MSKKGFLPGALLGTIILTVLLCSGLVACGSASGGGLTNSNVPTATTQQPSATATTSPVATQSAGIQLTPTPTLPPNAQNCGSITISLKGAVPAGSNKSNDGAVGNCFWQDYQQCKAATMSFRTVGVDTITTHSFVLTKKGSVCQITDTVQHIIAPNHIMNSATSACAGLNKDETRLIFNGCGRNGNVAVPLNQAYTPQE